MSDGVYHGSKGERQNTCFHRSYRCSGSLLLRCRMRRRCRENVQGEVCFLFILNALSLVSFFHIFTSSMIHRKREKNTKRNTKTRIARRNATKTMMSARKRARKQESKPRRMPKTLLKKKQRKSTRSALRSALKNLGTPSSRLMSTQ